MTFLKVMLILAVSLWLISLIRLGADAEYAEGVFSLKLILGPFRIGILPLKEKKPGKEKAKPNAPEAVSAEQPPKKKRSLPPVGDLIGIALEALGALRRKIRLDEVTLHLLWASSDPADAALGYGKAQAAMGAIWPVIENTFRVKKRDVGVAVDFERSQPEIVARGALTMTVGQLVGFALRFGVKLLILFRRSAKASPQRQEEMTYERTQPSNS